MAPGGNTDSIGHPHNTHHDGHEAKGHVPARGGCRLLQNSPEAHARGARDTMLLRRLVDELAATDVKGQADGGVAKQLARDKANGLTGLNAAEGAQQNARSGASQRGARQCVPENQRDSQDAAHDLHVGLHERFPQKKINSGWILQGVLHPQTGDL